MPDVMFTLRRRDPVKAPPGVPLLDAPCPFPDCEAQAGDPCVIPTPVDWSGLIVVGLDHPLTVHSGRYRAWRMGRVPVIEV